MSKLGAEKGSKGEREVAKLLCSWWEPVEPGAMFVRTPKSGGWLYGPEFDVCGDVVTTAKRFPFGVEVKRVQAWSLKVLIEGRPSPVWGFWWQCQRDAERVGREPMLWFRRNRERWLVMVRAAYMSGLKVKAPDVAWPERLLNQVDCGELPVVYLGERMLSHEPGTFAKRG